ncbi:LAME_0C06700g1_1 [Lachancea meyersii CBS 8951]|uniref:LAME_0C06700g1_1 n=1 Tax=Lachancea meyersii CBS 8951 TaxID=1266667 RepID=A0A1G4J2J0_9SACH|nr:LAME_0C06700g1_1 [Lachancea meyersii CBS 8951]
MAFKNESKPSSSESPMSQDHPDPEPAPSSKDSVESSDAQQPSKDDPQSFPALEWEQVHSSIPVESFTNYKIRLTGWARKDRLKKRIEEETRQREGEIAKKQKLELEQAADPEPNAESNTAEADGKENGEVKPEEKTEAGDEEAGSVPRSEKSDDEEVKDTGNVENGEA